MEPKMAAGIWTETNPKLRAMNLPVSDCKDADARDRYWLNQIAAGDEAALDELYTAYAQRLYAFALRLCADPAMAEDVVQDLLLTIWRDAGRYRAQGRVIAWLLGIVHHSAIKALRKGKRTVSMEQVQELVADLPSPEEQSLRSDLQDKVVKGMSTLSTEHREVLELVFYQKLSLEESARVLDCPVGTVKSRLSYARKALRGELERSGDGKESD
jgi:RNA polymerase sigma-70 factor (ECF subfamily)